jgi:signal transduction histidine kinase
MMQRATYFLFPLFPPALEDRFRIHYNETSAPVGWVALLLGGILYLAFYFWDLVVDYDRSSQTLFVRFVVASWFFAVAFVPRAIFAAHLQALMTPTIMFGGIGVVFIIFTLRDGLIVGVGGVVLVLMFNFGFFRLLFVPSLISGLVIFIAYNIAAMNGDLAASLIIANNFFLISALISGASVTFLMERLFRSQFVADIELARQHQTDTRYLEWLRQLAMFLRHEVRQPVAQINSSIELLKLEHGNDDKVEIPIQNALRGVQQVWNLIDRASRATDAEAFVRQSVAQVIDLEVLLTNLVEGHRQAYSGVTVGLKSYGPVSVNADPALVQEAVSNLLANAVSFAFEETTIEVSLLSTETHARVSIYNRGPLIEDDTEVLFTPFTSRRAGDVGEHQGLGLYLVRLVAEYYGGAAYIGNRSDSSGVEATIKLPLISVGQGHSGSKV